MTVQWKSITDSLMIFQKKLNKVILQGQTNTGRYTSIGDWAHRTNIQQQFIEILTLVLHSGCNA